MADRGWPVAAAWLLDEIASAGRENLDPEHVARYDLKEDADAEAEVALLVEVGLMGESVVLELGPGTGQFTIVVAQRCARVVAVDVSVPMLDVLSAKLAESRLSNVEVQNAGFLTFEAEADTVDFAYSRLALHHLPDFWKAVALTRIWNALRPGGCFRILDVVYNFEPSEAGDRLEAWCSTAGDSSNAAWSRSELEDHVREEHSTFTWQLESMIRRCRFEIDSAEYTDDGIFARYLLTKPAATQCSTS